MSGENQVCVRTVTRFIVTHFKDDPVLGNCSRQIGEYANQEQAEVVGRALAQVLPGATFQTLFSRPEPLATFFAYTREQSDAFAEVLGRLRQAEVQPTVEGISGTAAG